MSVGDNSQPWFPLAGGQNDGWSNDHEASATCFCGAVQLSFPTEAPGLVNTFVCNCTDCRKVTASMFASNFTIDDKYLKHVRGQENLKTYSQARTIATKNSMTNYFCSTCGTLMYRISSGMPGVRFLRIGTVDDFSLHETKFRPQVEQFVETRVNWCHGLEGIPQVEGMAV